VRTPRLEGGVFVSAYLATTIDGSVILPFVIPSVRWAYGPPKEMKIGQRMA
jgi:hypothetical protein